MSPRNPSSNVEILLEHANWLRKLARSLVGDVQQADDLSQETWLRALEHPPVTDRPVRAWLATVMRNVLKQEHRGSTRRSDRERRAAQRHEVSTDEHGLELLAKVARQRELVEAVLELDEPYRQAILLRYFEEYTPRRIATEMGVPVATVKTRLQRGLHRLRARLDEKSGGDGRTWALAMLPLARRPEGLTPALPWIHVPLGALAMNTKLVAAVLALGIASAALFIMSSGEEAAGSHEVARASERRDQTRPIAEHGAGIAAPRATETPASRRAPLGARPRAERPVNPSSVAAPLRVRGRVIDVEGRPVSGVDIRTGGETVAALREGIQPGPIALGTTESDGTFEVELDEPAPLVVQDSEFTTFMAAMPVHQRSGKETLLVVAPRIVLAGQVVDPNLAGVLGARIRITPPADLRARLGQVLDYSTEIEYLKVSGADGYFDLGDAPAIPGASFSVLREGFVAFEEAAPLESRAGMIVSLRRPEPTVRTLTGSVIDESGSPVEGALVALGIDSRTTDERGQFRFTLADPHSFNSRFSERIEVGEGRLLAIKAGYTPAELVASVDAEGEHEWPGHVVLQLGQNPLSIEGTVVDVGGQPLADTRVWIVDPTFFGGIGDPNASRFPRITNVETELAGGDSGWHFVETDANGRFEIDGVLDRDYTVQAMDPTTLLRTELTEIRGGTRNVQIVMPADAVYPVLRGTVVDRHGDPVPNVKVMPMCDSFRIRIQDQTIGTEHSTAAAVQTDAEGRFELSNVPRNLVYLRLDGVNTVPLEWGRRVEGGLYTLVGDRFQDLEIEVGRRCHFLVELLQPDEADQIGVLDAEGVALEISEFQGTGRNERLLFDLDAGRSNPLSVSDRAATLVLYLHGEEIRRVPLHLRADEQTTLRP